MKPLRSAHWSESPSSWSLLKVKGKHLLKTKMLCCGRKKDSKNVLRHHIIGEGSAYSSLAHHHHHQQPLGSNLRRVPLPASGVYQYPRQHGSPQLPLRSRMPEMVLQSDFRKVSGITSEIFRQIEAVENDFDPNTAAYFDSVEKRGEMIIRLLDPRALGRAGAEAGRKYLFASESAGHTVQFVEIIKRPGQTLGLYIREGDGYRNTDGVFISRIALESAVYNSGLLKVGDEVLAVNLVDVRRMSLDDVVIIMSIPRRLVLTIRSRTLRAGVHPQQMSMASPYSDDYNIPPVVVMKQEVEDDNVGYHEETSLRDSENGHLMHARMKGLPGDVPLTAVQLDGGLPPRSGTMEDQALYYNTRGQMGGVRGPLQVRDDSWAMMGQRNEYRRPYGIVTQQPHGLMRQYPRTLENLAENVHQFHSGYSSDVPLSRRAGLSPLQVTRAAVHRPPSAERQRYWDEYSQIGSRANRLLRTESDHRIPLTMSDDFLDRYMRPLSRGMRTPTPTGIRDYQGLGLSKEMRQRIFGDDIRDRRSPSAHAISSILRRRSYLDGSASDTEVSSPKSANYLLRQRSLGPYSRMVRGSSSRDSFQLRSSSLPRTRPTLSSDYRFTPPPRRGTHQRQSVRFDRQTLGYDDDSDGAVSAPELPASRTARRIARRATSPSVYSSREYRQWMVRAPSTSAIYESVRRARNLTSPLPLNSASLSKIAHSAESLLDTIRMEQQRNLLVDLHTTRTGITSRTGMSPLTQRPLSSPLYRDDSSGSLKITPHTYDYLRSGVTIPNPTPVKPTDDGRLHLLSLNPREFFKYRPEKPDPSSAIQEGFSGLLWVHLLAGRGLRSSAGHQLEHYRDVYCVIECDRIHKARTVVRTGEHSFDWDEVFELDMFDTKEIAFLLYTWDPQYRHKLCYKGIIHLVSLSLKETPVHSLALKMEPRGTLYVKLRYRDLQLSYQRSPPSVSASTSIPNPVFGVDLETLVTRENAGLNVPLILKRCIEEVNKRGLHLTGIYRLCGSAVRKRMLRDAFEKNAWLVDLSAEHVPDINVITSLLKDYLRELPEPLFTKALFDMMDDGLSVCLPDDPPGNAKLMFSILECLPKINRCTVFYLIDHIKLVMSQSDKNKMSAQSLATCFGPLFTCHSECETLHKPIEVFKFLLEIWPLRRVSVSKSGSSDSVLSAKPMPIIGQHPHQHQQSQEHLSSSLPIASYTQSTAITLASTATGQLPSMPLSQVTSSSMLPAPSSLTPGPSPTALTSDVGSASASINTGASEMEVPQLHQKPDTTMKKSVAWASNNHRSGDPSMGSGSGVSGISGHNGLGMSHSVDQSSNIGRQISRTLPDAPPPS